MILKFFLICVIIVFDPGGGAIAQVCYLNNVPFVIIRAISDKPNETEFVDYTVFEAQAAVRCANIVLYMVENQ